MRREKGGEGRFQGLPPSERIITRQAGDKMEKKETESKRVQGSGTTALKARIKWQGGERERKRRCGDKLHEIPQAGREVIRQKEERESRDAS